MKLLDLFCGEGGAGKGYQDAGFEITGVDNDPANGKRYPAWPMMGGFITADAIEYVREYGREYDAIHASPPCQAFTLCQRSPEQYHHWRERPPHKGVLDAGGLWVIENVPGAPLNDPIELCGAMFGLQTYRHRWFETSFPLTPPPHPEHVAATTKMGRAPIDGEFMHIVGNFIGVDRGRKVMGMPWASREGLREAVPPAYTEHIGHQLAAHVRGGS